MNTAEILPSVSKGFEMDAMTPLHDVFSFLIQPLHHSSFSGISLLLLFLIHLLYFCSHDSLQMMASSRAAPSPAADKEGI